MADGDGLLVLWSREAEQDLFDVWDTALITGNQRFAERVLQDIDRMTSILARWPEFGRARDHLYPGVRSAHVGRHTIFYRITKAAVEVIRVLDERRDIETIVGDFEGFAS